MLEHHLEIGEQLQWKLDGKVFGVPKLKMT
jgi:hypothetical protein